MKEQGKTGGGLFLSHRMPLGTVAVAFAAYFDFLRGLESGWNRDASCRLREGESAVSVALISILFLITRDCNFHYSAISQIKIISNLGKKTIKLYTS